VHRGTVALLVLCAALLLAAGTAGAAGGDHSVGAVYTLTNSAAGNAVAVFDRESDGALTPDGTFPTGGIGTGSNLGSQGAVILSDNNHELFAVNAGSNSISYFRVKHDGLEWQATAPSGGIRPISLTLHDHVLYALNAGGAGSITGFAVKGDELLPLAGSTQPLAAGSSGPAQVSFTPNGKVLVVTEKNSNTIDTYAVGEHGVAGPPTAHASSGATPFGFDFGKHGDLLVSEASGGASSYDVANSGSVTPISSAVSTHQSAPCWLVASKSGRYAYTANAGSGTISGYSVGRDGTLTLLDPSGISGNLGAGSHPLDESVSEDGDFLYVLVDGTHSIGTFRIAGDGALAFVGAVGGLPAGAVGLAAD
jgi:6-phosphogluconolactonase